MDLEALKAKLESAGVVGAGGAGFPAFRKLAKAETIIVNCAECEPLLMLHKQLLAAEAEKIVKALNLVAEVCGASEAVIALKHTYKDAIAAVTAAGGKVKTLNAVYPAGDEVVLVYEVTGRVVPPGSIPISQGVIVFNVETMYNIYHAVFEDKPVTEKLVTITGAVANPITVAAKLGTPINALVDRAGGAKVKNSVYLVGGPMMGNLLPGSTEVTKTTNAVIVLAEDHPLVLRKQTRLSAELKRASSACCQCRTCTDLCPRHLLGHPIEPHAFMRAASDRNVQDTKVFLNAMFCSGCGVCEAYACPQGLSPRRLIGEYRLQMRKAGVAAPKTAAGPVDPDRRYHQIPAERLAARLGLDEYNVMAPWVREESEREGK